MRRACKLTLKFATARKRRAVAALLEAYRAAVNFYIESLWESPGRLDKETLARLPAERTRLSARYKSQALKQSLETVVGTKRAARETGKPCTLPVFKGSAVLDGKFVDIETGRGSFDLVVKLACLARGQRISLPTRRTRVVNKWLAFDGASLVQGCALSENRLILWVDVPNARSEDDPSTPVVAPAGPALGLDIGMDKLLALSDGTFLGDDFAAVRRKVARRLPGSKGKFAALRERDNYIRRQVNLIPWRDISMLAVEDLKHMKTGKSPNRSKAFRRAAAPWTYRQVLVAIGHKAQEHRVTLVAVPPAYTSQRCPSCGTVDRLNRSAGTFDCVACSFHGDADSVGAVNVLAKAMRMIGSVESPMLPKGWQIDMTI